VPQKKDGGLNKAHSLNVSLF